VLETYPSLDNALADGRATGRRHPAC
jgi:hypothetical protein